MKYVAVKHNKTGMRDLGSFSSIAEAHEAITTHAKGARFIERTYMGGFPLFSGKDGKTYSIQGEHETLGLPLSIDSAELTAAGF